jgi:simple sugar transport system substrate-binding protein
MKILRKLAVFSLGVMLVASLFSAAANAAPKYTFFHLLWSLTDPNVQFHIKGGEAYMKANPDVQIKYVGPDRYDPAEHAKFLDTIINANPDGIALHFSSVDALLPGLREAKKRGIPVVSVTSHPPSAEDEAKLKGLYLTSIGADESLIGGVIGERLLESIKPVRVAYVFATVGHAGQERRASGFFASMPEGVKTDKVVIGEDPQTAKDAIRAYLVANPDVNAVFGVALSTKWFTDVSEEMGRADVQVLTADAAPISLDCVLNGKCLATFSQQFPIQAPMAYEVLYWYQETQMWPVTPVTTGPMIVDSSNAQVFKDVVIDILGEDEYNKLSPF